MPQLDIVSFFPQFFWFCLFFTTFYVTLVQKYLPTLTRIFAARTAVTQPQTTTLTSEEFDSLDKKTHQVFSKSIQNTKTKTAQQFQQTQQLLDIQTNVFNTHTHQVFEKYQNKKVLLNMTVKQTMQQMQDVLPFYKIQSAPKNQTKTAQFFSKAVFQKVCDSPVKKK
jgi:cobyric acid synthase